MFTWSRYTICVLLLFPHDLLLLRQGSFNEFQFHLSVRELTPQCEGVNGKILTIINHKMKRSFENSPSEPSHTVCWKDNLYLIFNTAGALAVITVWGLSNSTPFIHPLSFFAQKPHNAISQVSLEIPCPPGLANPQNCCLPAKRSCCATNSWLLFHRR